ncbi:DNA phosphorothioation-dependent restriction protein DptH [Paenisporosarcina quisquiliarum]|uniref:DNA phosphorothioation-dependent restriction protein DptH n=1 Tax=Paenisporosarcina quisquiliarum TaxID=365346 RepID=A0A9X3LI05_9BACL|nr:DNA phosphorothioation-dependent restriction protein DptH [Paenisporosarcina quisquiliarum]MCZ8538303.1 DNA phosphorothioation-dependent restriction protein DptH [Paenisporosarcina quisquiliarum]
MSNQFFKYISTLIIEHFTREGIKSGDRYYLQLDNDSDVEKLVNGMKENDSQIFIYKHELGDEYYTFSLPLGEVNLVVANTSEVVKPDFLVTLRNLVGEQKGIWKDTALISIVSEQLDSIQGGSSDLQKEGMPLHPNSLFVSLKNKIENSTLEKTDQIILLDNLDSLLKEQVFLKINLFDFEDIFSTLNKGRISDKEYYKFGLFKDPDLSTFNGKEQKKRIEENRDLFDFVKKVHNFGLDKEELENRFSPTGANELIAENWMEMEFPKVFKHHSDFINLNKKTKIDLNSLKVLDKLILWNKPLSEKANGKRKRNIVIFNPDGKKEVDLQMGFSLVGSSKSLSSQYLKIPRHFTADLNVKVMLTNLTAKIKTEPYKPTFVRFSYKHDNKAALGAEFSIAVLPIDPIYLDEYKSSYLIDADNGHIQIQYEDEELHFGNGLVSKKIEIKENNQRTAVSQDERLTIVPLPEAYNDDDELKITIDFDQVSIPIIFKNELPESLPITGHRLWKLIRESGQDIQWIKENNRLILENREFYFHSEYREFFEWESYWIEKGLKHAKFESGQLISQNINLSDNLREAYSRLITYFKISNTIPSLCTITADLKARAQEYINEYQNEISTFKDGSPAGSKGRDIFKLGTIVSNETLYFTPLHPIMLAFKLKVYELLNTEEIENSILSRITPDSLVPFLYDEKTLFKPEHQQAVMEWLTFKPVNQISVSDANQYLAKVVSDKISQFKEHFSYLFIQLSQAPLQLNVINISNDIEVVRGILQWMLEEIKKNGAENLKPIEVTLYKDENVESAFEIYARTDTVEQFEELFQLRLNKIKDMDSDDVLRIIREKLFFYSQEPSSDFRYAHISFYKMHAQEHHAVQPINDMNTGLAIEGLYSSVPSMRDEETYKSGFGTKGYSNSIEDLNYLTTVAYYFNELAANLRNGGNDSYRKGEAILSRITTADEVTLEKIFKSSYWVTFVDPSVDLEFFNKYNGNLVVIHYSDQYSSSSRFDAITVTDKSQQYYAVIKEFLIQKNVEGTDENVLNTIKAFNTFNGEWLLRIIGSKGHFDREKLSIISAIKYSVSYFDHPNILWIPISLEEVLRVAGVVGLSKSEGVFTAKNLQMKGSKSDDLLLIGLEINNGQIALHFYPIEVKIGLNKGEVLNKARSQVKNTKNIFIDALTGEMGETFSGRFYRNFFAQLVISNAKKLEQSDFWIEKNYSLSDVVIEKLLKDDYIVSNSLSKYIGDGAILSFQKDAYHRSALLEDEVLLLNLTEKDGYEGLIASIKQMRTWMHEEQNDFIKEEMLSNIYKVGTISPAIKTISVPLTTSVEKGMYILNTDTNVSDKMPVESPSIDDTLIEIEVSEGLDNDSPDKESMGNSIEKEDPIIVPVNDEKTDSIPLEKLRIKIGRAENSSREIFWEYGNNGLANRHLLISGKSGQGKTYFMQCLLLEKSKLGIPSIVIDYTEGFLPNQLEPEFVEYLGDKINQKIVYSEKLPINPFQRNIRDIGGIQLPESNTDVAERIKSVFSAVYKTLGIQQLNAIYEAVSKGLELYNSNLNLVKLKQLLEEDGSSYAKTALSQIRPLIDRNPFSLDNGIDWKKHIESNGEIYIIQLTGFPRDVQLIITEFILWDLWNYSVRFGNKNEPIPVIMDEAQNLDHTEKSPSARVLTEGRKFGWSAWYATQFLKSQLDIDELARLQNSSQKVYFSPPEQELSNIASSLTKDAQEKKHWENKLSSLRKGQCIVHGPILQDNGELSNPTVTVVNIIPLSERI